VHQNIINVQLSALKSVFIFAIAGASLAVAFAQTTITGPVEQKPQGDAIIADVVNKVTNDFSVNNTLIIQKANDGKEAVHSEIASNRITPEQGKIILAALDQRVTSPEQEKQRIQQVSVAVIQLLVAHESIYSKSELEQAASLLQIGRFDDAKPLLERIRTLAQLAPQEEAKAQSATATYQLALIAEREARFPQAVELIDEAIRLAPTDPKFIAYAARLNAYLGHTDDAVRQAIEAEKNASASADFETMLNIGDAFHDGLRWDDAKRVYTGLLERVTDSSVEIRRQRFLVLNSLGGLSTRLNDLRSAEHYLREAHTIAGQISPMSFEHLVVGNNLGLNYLHLGCIAAAGSLLDWVLRAPVNRLPNNHPLRAFSSVSRGRVSLANGDTKDALDRVGIARDMVVQALGRTHWRVGQFEDYLGEIQLANQDYAGGERQLRAAVEHLKAAELAPTTELLRTQANLSLALFKTSGAIASGSARQPTEIALIQLPKELRGPIAARLALLDAEIAASARKNDQTLAALRSAIELDSTYYIQGLILHRLLPKQLTSMNKFDEVGAEVKRRIQDNGCDQALRLQ
jgi:tetratricopeptide (TPR) repeat protein